MKVLQTKKQFEAAVFKILSSKPKFLYIATYGINLNSEFCEKIFKNCPKNTRVIIGVRGNSSEKQRNYYRWWFRSCGIDVELVEEFHAKMIVSDKYCIVGGRNLTDSDWIDVSFLLTTKASIKACKSSFEKILKK